MGKVAKKYETSFGDMDSMFLFFNDGVVPIPSKKESILSDAGSYLQKGEKLLTLAKEHFKRVCSVLKVSNFEEKFYALNFTSADSTQFTDFDGVVGVATKLMRKILRAAESVEDEALAHVLDTIRMHYQLDFELVVTEPVRFSLLFGEKVAKLTLVEEGYTPLVVYGLKDKTHPKKDKSVLLRTGECVGDLATILATLYLFSIVHDYMGKMDAEEVPTQFLVRVLLHLHKGYGRMFSFEDTYADVKDVFSMRWVVPSDKENLFSLWKEFFLSYGVRVEHSTLESRDLFKDISLNIQKGYYSRPGVIPLVFNEDVIRHLVAFMPVATVRFLGRLPYISLLTMHLGSSTHWPLINYYVSGAKWEEAVLSVFGKVYEEKHGQVEALKTLKELDGEHAKSYQTKKNIPQKTISAMEGSSFNDYFGYVEYDEDVDLKAVKVIEDEFLAFKETHFSFIDAKKNSLRFRKLGNHKALGLYYPSVRCLCVDIHSPSSFIHEFGHLIDYCYGNLSIGSEFSDIRMLYKSRLMSFMQKDTCFSATMNGKTKYNLNYYLKPTEVFARCFEIYCVKVLNIHNSLVSESFGMAYPVDDAFVEQVARYFKGCFESLDVSADSPVDSKAAIGY